MTQISVVIRHCIYPHMTIVYLISYTMIPGSLHALPPGSDEVNDLFIRIHDKTVYRI